MARFTNRRALGRLGAGDGVRKTERGQIRILERTLRRLDDARFASFHQCGNDHGTINIFFSHEEADVLHRAAAIGLGELFKLLVMPVTPEKT